MDLTDHAAVLLRGVRVLKLIFCRRITAAACYNFTSLRELTVRQCNLGSGIVQAQGLEVLDIADNQMSAEMAGAVARLPLLRTLRLPSHIGAARALDAPHVHLRALSLIGGLELSAEVFSTPVFDGRLVELYLDLDSNAAFTDFVLARQQKLESLSLIHKFPLYNQPQRPAPVSAAAVDALPCLVKLNTFKFSTLVAAEEFPLHEGCLILTHHQPPDLYKN